MIYLIAIGWIPCIAGLFGLLVCKTANKADEDMEDRA